MQALWLTDIHLNFVNDLKKKAFFQKIAATDSDCLLISGDIAEGHSFAPDLVDLSSVVQRPIYFVLGNHDFYHSSIRSARKMALGVTAELSTLRYVSENEVYLLTERSALIGHDGWADGRLGRYDTSNLDMNDFQFIKELSALEYHERLQKMQMLSDESLKHIERYLPQALQSREQVILLTHVPPFQASCQYGGAPCDNDRLPFYTNSALGEFLINIMKNAKNNRLLVLSGHTHVKTEYRPLRNLLVITGKAEYGSPQVQRIFRL